MYSVILMAAMTAPADAASWGSHGGCSCSGSSCAGSCHGYSCGGSSCHGGCHGLGIFGHRHSCYGCGGCTGGTCHGAGACYGYAFAGSGISYGFAGCYGSCYGSYTNFFSYWAHPIQSGYGYGMPMRIGPPAKMAPPVAPPAGDPKPPVKPVEPPKKPADKGTEEDASIQATVIVTLPADATLYANGVRTRQTSTERRFITPPLESGMIYNYTLTIEVARNGRMVTETREVEVQAGSEVRVAFEREGTRVVAERD
jgi:uncharacterized protein (TIGR03000 family)